MESLSAPLSGPLVRSPGVAFRLASDARLARLAATGNEGAMAAIFERHHQALQRYCYSILANSPDAADALQNTMIKALRALPGETRQIALRPWLYRIAHNESISLLRARRADSDLDAAAHVSDAAAAGVLESRERLRALTEDLGELTERQRGALLMRELGGLQFTEVADALGTSATAVKQSVYEARCALQSMQEGRTMDCETVQRTLSDGDRRMLRGLRMRAHLRACAPCRDFELALHHRPAQLTALIPPLPLAAAAAILHGLVGGGSSAGGGGLAAGLAGTAKATTGLSLAAKATAVMAIGTTLGAGTVYVATELASAGPERSAPRTDTAGAADTPSGTPTATNIYLQSHRSRASAARTAARDDVRPGDRATSRTDRPTGPDRPSGAGRPTGTRGGRPSGAGRPTGTPGGRPSGAGRPTGTPGRRPSGAGKPTGTPGGKPSGAGKPTGTPTIPAGTSARPTGTSAPQATTPAVGATGTSGPPHNAPSASTGTTHGSL